MYYNEIYYEILIYIIKITSYSIIIKYTITFDLIFKLSQCMVVLGLFLVY